MCTMCLPGAFKGRKRVSDLLDLELQVGVESSCGFLKKNPGPLQDQQVLLSTEPYFQFLRLGLELGLYIEYTRNLMNWYLYLDSMKN